MTSLNRALACKNGPSQATFHLFSVFSKYNFYNIKHWEMIHLVRGFELATSMKWASPLNHLTTTRSSRTVSYFGNLYLKQNGLSYLILKHLLDSITRRTSAHSASLDLFFDLRQLGRWRLKRRFLKRRLLLLLLWLLMLLLLWRRYLKIWRRQRRTLTPATFVVRILTQWRRRRDAVRL